MRWGIVRFPGSFGAEDFAEAVCPQPASGDVAVFIGHLEADLPDVEVVVLPAGMAFDDLPRVGVLAARSPVLSAIRRFADAGGLVVGLGNGFQILCEAGLLPGRFDENACGGFLARPVRLRVENVANPLVNRGNAADRLWLPMAARHAAWRGEKGDLESLERNGRIILRYDPLASGLLGEDPIGAEGGVAALTNHASNVVGAMVNPEYAALPRDRAFGLSSDGNILFESLRAWVSLSAGRESSSR